MAIRSGTGGLKYPLPSQYQIGAQQSAAAASAGGSAASSAFAANRAFAANKMRVQADLANSAADRDFRARSQMQEQGFRAQQEFYDREHQAGAQLQQQEFAAGQQDQRLQQAREMQWQNQYFQTERDRQEQSFRSAQDVRQFNKETYMGLPEIPENATPDQRRMLQTNRDAMQNLLGRGWDPTEPGVRDTFNQQLQEYRSGVQAIPKPTLDDQFAKNTLEKNGRLYQYDQKGRQFSELSDLGQKDAAKAQQKLAADQQKQQGDIYKEANDIMSEGIEGQTFDKALETVRSRRAQAGLAVPGQSEGLSAGAGGVAGQPAAAQMGAAAGARPETEVQSIVNDVRSSMKDVPIEEGKETPELRSFMDKNMEDIVRYNDTPLDQVPEAARPAVDFYGRYLRSHTQGQPITLRTPEEAAMLPPGTPYIDDQGNKRVTKKKAG